MAPLKIHFLLQIGEIASGFVGVTKLSSILNVCIHTFAGILPRRLARNGFTYFRYESN